MSACHGASTLSGGFNRVVEFLSAPAEASEPGGGLTMMQVVHTRHGAWMQVVGAIGEIAIVQELEQVEPM